MKFKLLFSLLVLLLFSCNPAKNKKVDQTTLSFKTDDSSKLYFKNVRQSYYDVDVMEEAKLEVYRLKKRVEESEEPVINLALVNNWRYDEAYVLLEPNTAAGDLNTLNLSYENENGESGDIIFEKGDKKNHLAFASKVYEQIQNESDFFLNRNGEKVEILRDSKSREAFRISMFDYYRLTLAY